MEQLERKASQCSLMDKSNAKNTNKTDQISFDSNDQLSVLRISTSTMSTGTILDCNSEVQKYLGYEKSELLGQNVHKIMPNIYRQIHDSFIKRYIESIGEDKLPSRKLVYAMKKNRKIAETMLTVKIFPNIEMGFQLVGFFKEHLVAEKKAVLLMNMRTMKIEGMNEEFVRLAQHKINVALLYNEPLSLSQVFPEMMAAGYREGTEVETTLCFTDCTDKLIETESGSELGPFEKKVVVRFEKVYDYGSVKVGIISVSRNEEEASISNAYPLNTIKRLVSEKKVNKLEYRTE